MPHPGPLFWEYHFCVSFKENSSNISPLFPTGGARENGMN